MLNSIQRERERSLGKCDNFSFLVVGGKLSFQYGGIKMIDDSKFEVEGKIYFF